MVNIPEELRPYVNDYKINVVEVSFLSKKQLSMFKSDFRIVADFFVQKRKNKDYIPSKDTIKHVDALLRMMFVLTGDSRYEEVQNESEGGIKNMCEVLDKISEQGRAEGRAEGRMEGEQRLAGLIQELKREGLEDVIDKVCEDKKLREEMYRKYNL